MKNRLIKKIQFKGTLTLKTGLHIGDSKDNVQIGGVDSPIIRRKDNNQPLIPGSSLKGKIRSLLEQTRGAIKVGDGGNDINSLFGFAEDDKPSKIIVRDAYLTPQSAKELNESEFIDFPYTEVKFENSIDRIKGSAGNPRKIERVPVGAKFTIDIVLNVWKEDNESEMIELLKEGFNLLANDYLGGNGSRGYGQVSLNLDFDSPIPLYESKLEDNGN